MQPSPSGTNRFMHYLRKFLSKLHLHPQNPEQLLALLRKCSKHNVLDGQSLKMMEGVLQTATMQVRDIMVPRAQMVCLDISKTPQACVKLIQAAKHSRYPVIGDSRDDILGILMAKDMLAYFSDQAAPPIESLYHTPLFTPESRRLDELLRDFQIQHHHMAIVADEYGGVAGLVTIEDIIEQIVGDIEDEFYQEEDHMPIQKDGDTYLIKGIAEISEVNQALGVELNQQKFDTIGGLLTHQFGHIPSNHETIEYAKIKWEVIHADDRCIRLLSAHKISPPAAP